MNTWVIITKPLMIQNINDTKNAIACFEKSLAIKENADQ
jgi:hypothetical protein